MPLTPRTPALAGAMGSAAATILIRQGLQDSNFYAGFWINVIIGVVGLWGIIVLTEAAEVYRLSALPCLIVSGFVVTVGGRLLRFASIEKVGAAVAASTTNLNPFIAAGLAILLLGERVAAHDVRQESPGHRG